MCFRLNYRSKLPPRIQKLRICMPKFGPYDRKWKM